MMKSQVAGTAYMNMPVLSDNEDMPPLSQANARNKTLANYVTFNQDGTCVALGVDDGYRIYSCKPKVSKCLASKKRESVGIVEMLYCTSLLVIVGTGEETGSSPRKLKILNIKRQTTLCDLVFPSTILSVKLSHHRLIVLLEEQIYIYDITTMNLLHTIETSPNIGGLCALTNDHSDNGVSLLAYPSPPKTITHESLLVNGVNTNGGSNSAQNNIQSVSSAPNRVGDAIIFDLVSLQPLAVIEAHKSALSAMCFSNDGSLLATASDKGTIVRVFNVQSGLKLYQFRRGTYPTKIYDLTFSKNNRYVIATSASETVHIFRLGDEELLANKQKQNQRSKVRQRAETQDYQIIHEEPETASQNQERVLAGESGNRDNGEQDTDRASEEEGNIIEDDGDDSDAEREIEEDDKAGEEDESDDNMSDAPSKHRKLSQGSSHSFTSVASGISNNSNSDDVKERADPIIDQNRLSVARIIRRSSQNLGRKAAQKMGDFLPSRFSSILEPTRHFASLKIQSIGKDVKSVATLDDSLDTDDVKSVSSINSEHPKSEFTSVNSHTGESSQRSLLRINVATSEGYIYTYGLDADRGGDCILLQEFSLLDDR